jgi:hypothetical protein
MLLKKALVLSKWLSKKNAPMMKVQYSSPGTIGVESTVVCLKNHDAYEVGKEYDVNIVVGFAFMNN